MQRRHTPSDARGRVLLIDDDRALTELLALILSTENLDVRAANDGRHGLALARHYCPSLIVVDLHIPDMDALTFIDACRGIAGCAEVPIFLVTGQPRAALMARDRLQGKGVVLLMPKPLDLETLISAVHGAIRSHATPQGPARTLEGSRVAGAGR